MAVAQAKEPMRIVDLPIIAAGEDAAAAVIKRELARELHDQVAQHLTSVLVQMQCAKREHRRASDVADQFTDLEASVREVLNNVREILSDLRGQPGIADRFVDAVRLDLISKFQSRTGIKVVLSVARAWPASLPPDTAIHLYRIIQEALANAHKHGGAQTAHVALRAQPDRFVVNIRDDGRGIAWLDEAEPVGFGILGMRERAALLRGVITIHNRPRGGISVTATFPKEVMHWQRRRALSAS